MTAELQEAISKVEKLDDAGQIQIARMITDEIDWDNTFAKTQNQLGELALQAIEEHVLGKTKNEDW